MLHLLLLDDDEYLLDELQSFLVENGFRVSKSTDVSGAITALSDSIDFAIVDLFLAGNDGDSLSNDFIREHLVPNGIRYGRLTSAPKMVPQDTRGEWVLDKRQVVRDLGILLNKLLQVAS